MTVFHSAFSERLFEFAFNAEFIAKGAGQIIGMPDIPSQNEEEWLGYDVAFDIQNGTGVTDVLALQHKVARLVDGKGGPSNKHFRAMAGNPYLVFPIDPFQFNTIEELSSVGLPGLTFRYCAPLFVDRPNLNARYAAKDLDANSVYIDVSNVGRLDESIPHSIVYTPAGTQAWVFSDEPKTLKADRAVHYVGDGDRGNELSTEEIEKLYLTSFDIISESYQHRIAARLGNALPDDPSKVAEFAALNQRLRAAAPNKINYENTGECLLTLSRLFASYLGATTIIKRFPS